MNKLKSLRKESKLNQKELEDKLNIDRTTISRLENGLSSFTQEQLQSFSSFFNVSIDYLIGNTNQKRLNSIVAENIPVYSHLYGGIQTLREENKINYCAAPKTKDLSNSVYLSCPKDILNEKIFKGDLLLINLKHHVEHGLYVIAHKDQPGTIHRVINVSGQWGFLENNNLNKLSDYEVIGKVDSVTRDII